MCYICGTEQDSNIVYSGVDAFILECMEFVGKICYTCANEQKGKVTA